MRGKALRDRIRFDRLPLAQQLDFAESLILDSHIFGFGVGIDKAAEALEEAIVEMYPTRETFGATPAAIRAAERAQGTFAPKRKPTT